MLESTPERQLKTFGLGLHAAALALLVLTAGSVYGLVLRPLDRWIAEAGVDAAELEAQYAEGDTLRAEHDRLKAELIHCNKRAERLGRRVPILPEEAGFLSQVQATANRVGLVIRDYLPGAQTSRNGHSQLEIQLTCVGKFGSLCRFLEEMGAADRLSRVTQLEISTGGADGYTVKMTILVYFKLKLDPMASVRAGGDGNG